MRPSRRIVALLGLGLGLASCRSASVADVGSGSGVGSADPRVLEVRRGAPSTAPLVVGLHGRGGWPARFAKVFDDLPTGLDVVAIQAPLPVGRGFQWFEWGPATTDAELARHVGDAAAALWPEIERLAHGRDVIVTGFSQGAMMTYALAVAHPDAIIAAFPISGFLPAGLEPTSRAKVPPIYALHGDADPSIDIARDRDTVARLRATGAPIELHELAGVSHTITPEMQADLTARLTAAARPRR